MKIVVSSALNPRLWAWAMSKLAQPSACPAGESTFRRALVPGVSTQVELLSLYVLASQFLGDQSL